MGGNSRLGAYSNKYGNHEESREKKVKTQNLIIHNLGEGEGWSFVYFVKNLMFFFNSGDKKVTAFISRWL